MFPRRRLERAWKMGSELIERTGEVALTPWDALLIEVRRSAYHVEWIGARLNEAITRHKQIEYESSHVDPEYKESSREMRSWLTESRRERRHLAIVAKAAIDAGIATTIVQQVQLQGQVMSQVLSHALDALNLDDEQRLVATRALREALLEQNMTSSSGEHPSAALEGEIVDPDDGPLDGLTGDENTGPDEPSGSSGTGPEKPPDDPPPPPMFRNPGDFL